MRLKVICEFNDKYTDEFYVIGTELDVSDDRASELVKAGVVEVIPDDTTAPTSKEKRTKKA